jgi:hypothetical protein
MNTLVKSVTGAVAFVVATTTQASADVTLWMVGAARRTRHGGGHNHHPSHNPGHHPGHGGGGGGGVPSAPEVDISQAAAAIVVVLIAFLLIRELYLRQRQAA